MNSQGQRARQETARHKSPAWMLRALANAAAKLRLAPSDAKARQIVASRTKHSAARAAPNGRARTRRIARRTMAMHSRHVNERRRYAMRHK